jgi:hypothetical protein
LKVAVVLGRCRKLDQPVVLQSLDRKAVVLQKLGRKTVIQSLVQKAEIQTLGQRLHLECLYLNRQGHRRLGAGIFVVQKIVRLIELQGHCVWHETVEILKCKGRIE